MTVKKRKVSCTFKREKPLEFQERIYRLIEIRARSDEAGAHGGHENKRTTRSRRDTADSR
jgi:hypothetical protein